MMLSGMFAGRYLEAPPVIPTEYVMLTTQSSPAVSIYRTDTWASLPVPTVSNGRNQALIDKTGRFLAIGGSTGTATDRLMLWNWPMLTPVTLSSQPTNTVHAVGFSPDGEYVFALCNAVSAVFMYETSTGSAVSHGITSPTSGYALAEHPTSHIVAIGLFNSIRIYNTATLSQVANLTISGACYGIRFSPDGSMLVHGESGGDRIRRWSTSTWTQIATNNTTGRCFSLDYRPNGSIVTVGTNASSPTNQILNFNTGTWVYTGINNAGGVLNQNIVQYHPDQSLLVVGGRWFDTSTYSLITGPVNTGSATSIWITDTPVPV